MCTVLQYIICMLYCAHHPKPCLLPSPFILLLPTSTSLPTLPSGNHHTAVCLYEVVFFQSPSYFSPGSPNSFPSVSCESVLCVYESVSILFLSFLLHQILHISEIIGYMSFSDWLISLSIIFSRSIHAVAKGKISFLFTAEQYSIVYMYHSFFMHSSTVGHLGCLQILAIVNNAAMNIWVHIFFSLFNVWGFLGYIPRNRITGSQAVPFFNLLR